MARPKKKEFDKKTERFIVQLTPIEVEVMGGREKVYEHIQSSITDKIVLKNTWKQIKEKYSNQTK